MSRSLKKEFRGFIRALQDEICGSLEKTDGKARFREDLWQREGGGGGITRVMENGEVFEKAGVNTSEVHGELPELIRRRFKVNQGQFYASGISLVIHPASPMVPTVHANFRYFELYENQDGPATDAWFGGGADLTPYYIWEEDVRHFHRTLCDACDRHDKILYPRFKKECDKYFINAHRNEFRGTGGIFFDYLRESSGKSIRQWLELVKTLGNAFLPAYLPIVSRRRTEPFDEQQRYFQEIRRGRYAEFNLIHDRGTLFGLKTGGRTESILMSLPPRARWDYDFNPKPGSREAFTMEALKKAREWI